MSGDLTQDSSRDEIGREKYSKKVVKFQELRKAVSARKLIVLEGDMLRQAGRVCGVARTRWFMLDGGRFTTDVPKMTTEEEGVEWQRRL